MLCFDVYALNHAFARLYKPLLAPLGLTYPQYLAMSVLWDTSPLPVGRIGARVGLETSTLTPLLKRLELQGLITRTRARDDERRVEIGLTEAGRALSQRAVDIPACVERATGLDADEISALRATLSNLRAAIEPAG
ncbi:MarR family transcriptional regulator [Maribius pontilimi]|uniref:MarR family transcriptional regulator n=2 Tax=Palleronia pontilimi TaxID=1964209 RepID=A0A934I9Y4_9RHOB|nr:MarR family transcriptional regulator [Palleronia pontilimi]